MSNELALSTKDGFDQAVKIATTLSKSQIVPMNFRGKPEDCFAALVLGSELGMAPMQSLNAISMINGQCTLKASAQLALVYSRLPRAHIEIILDEKNLIAICIAGRTKDDTKYTATWDMYKAQEFGLAHKDNYKKQPLNMLKWRAVTEALRVKFPDFLMGLLSAEEAEDIPASESISATFTKDIDRDFPIPQEEKVVGDQYRVQHGKFRGKQLKDLGMDEIADFRETLIKRTTPKKEWEVELIDVFGQYLGLIEGTNNKEETA